MCDYTLSPHTCKPVTPLGAACSGTTDTSCGLGNTCRGATCAPGAKRGAACVYDLECASWSCSFGLCTDPNIEVATPFTCNGG